MNIKEVREIATEVWETIPETDSAEAEDGIEIILKALLQVDREARREALEWGDKAIYYLESLKIHEEDNDPGLLNPPEFHELVDLVDRFSQLKKESGE